MAEKIDMSLDDIIKRDRISVGRGRGRGGAAGKFANRTKPGRKGTGGAAPGRGRRIVAGNKKIAATSRQMKASTRNVGAGGARVNRGVPDGKWQHDKFGTSASAVATVGSAVDLKSSSLMISNLDYGVSDQDIRELFTEFGPLKKAAVHYDSSGRSLGKADVVFLKPADAMRAMKKYNGVPLDGRPMAIQLLVTNPAAAVAAANKAAKASLASRIGLGNGKLGLKQQIARGRTNARQVASAIGGGRGARRGARGGQRGAGRGNARANQKRSLTAEQLDADLDAYTNKM